MYVKKKKKGHNSAKKVGKTPKYAPGLLMKALEELRTNVYFPGFFFFLKNNKAI
jgi:hypothetical protein